jgi:hypothetical protein
LRDDHHARNLLFHHRCHLLGDDSQLPVSDEDVPKRVWMNLRLPLLSTSSTFHQTSHYGFATTTHDHHLDGRAAEGTDESVAVLA